MPGWVPGASSKNCGGPQYSLTKGLADGFTARVLIPQWQPYAAVELEFSEGWEFQIERVWGASRLPELGVSAYSQRKTFVLDATAPVVHGPEGYGCFGDEPEADDRQRGCLDKGCELMFSQVLSIKDPAFASRCAVDSHTMLEWIADCGWELQSVASGGWVASGGGVVASGVEVFVFFRSDSEDSFDPLK